jgi:hypothetical protein
VAVLEAGGEVELRNGMALLGREPEVVK